MDWKEVAGKIVNILPAASAMVAPFLGPAGVAAPLAAAAIKAISAAFGITDPDPQPDNVMAAINADPNAVLTLKTAMVNFEMEKMKLEFQERDQIRQHENEELKTFMQDMQYARIRDTEIRKAGQLNVRADVLLIAAFGTVIAIYATCAYFGEQRIGQMLIGSMLTAAGTFIQKIGTAFDFEFGSSRGSIQKTELLAKAEPIK